MRELAPGYSALTLLDTGKPALTLVRLKRNVGKLQEWRIAAVVPLARSAEMKMIGFLNTAS
jgi:hypothetical protein